VRKREAFPLILLAGILGVIVVQGRQMGRDRATHPRPSASVQGASSDTADTIAAQPTGARAEGATLPGAAASDLGPVELKPSGIPAPLRDDAVIRAQIHDNATGTYIADILQERQQFLVRWPDRRADGLRVWIERESTVSDWNAAYPAAVERALGEWHDAGFPIQFDVVTDPVGADITVRWVQQLDGRRIGVTSISRDQSGWLVNAEINVALHDAAGAALTPDLVAGIARHELGHALGLGHSSNKTDVMFPESTSPTISDTDRATLHLLYMLPPGLVR